MLSLVHFLVHSVCPGQCVECERESSAICQWAEATLTFLACQILGGRVSEVIFTWQQASPARPDAQKRCPAAAAFFCLTGGFGTAYREFLLAQPALHRATFVSVSCIQSFLTLSLIDPAHNVTGDILQTAQTSRALSKLETSSWFPPRCVCRTGPGRGLHLSDGQGCP